MFKFKYKLRCFFSLAICLFLIFPAKSQVLTLDSCRALAIKNNKELKISQENIKSTHFQHRAAATNYLPKVSIEAGYIRSQKELSILNSTQKEELSNLGTNFTSAVGTTLQQQMAAIAQQFPSLVPLIQSLSTTVLPTISTGLNGLGSQVVDAFRTDNRGMFAGSLTLIQPLFMGGKIAAYDRITRYAEELAKSQHQTGLEDVILSVDQAYWQVISLQYKQSLAKSYLELLNKLDSDITKLIENGMATKADGLSVSVKQNEAEMTLVKVEDGLSLAKMLLCQICGIEITKSIQLKDEGIDTMNLTFEEPIFDVYKAFENRSELKSLSLANQIYNEKIKVSKSEFFPKISLFGSYMVTNPNLYNGFEKKLKGNLSLGVGLTMPIISWGENIYKVRQAKADAAMQKYRYDDTLEKIELQVNQSAFKVTESTKRFTMSTKNLEKAEENLRVANLGFKEGVIAASNVLEAYTAWLLAQSERIDAGIDIRLAKLYLDKSLGILK